MVLGAADPALAQLWLGMQMCMVGFVGRSTGPVPGVKIGLR